jgi:hypothetical protein
MLDNEISKKSRGIIVLERVESKITYFLVYKLPMHGSSMLCLCPQLSTCRNSEKAVMFIRQIKMPR